MIKVISTEDPILLKLSLQALCNNNPAVILLPASKVTFTTYWNSMDHYV
jgi:hypothetical protein